MRYGLHRVHRHLGIPSAANVVARRCQRRCATLDGDGAVSAVVDEEQVLVSAACSGTDEPERGKDIWREDGLPEPAIDLPFAASY